MKRIWIRVIQSRLACWHVCEGQSWLLTDVGNSGSPQLDSLGCWSWSETEESQMQAATQERHCSLSAPHCGWDVRNVDSCLTYCNDGLEPGSAGWINPSLAYVAFWSGCLRTPTELKQEHPIKLGGENKWHKAIPDLHMSAVARMRRHTLCTRPHTIIKRF